MSRAAESGGERFDIKLIRPAEGTLVVSKKPVIECRFNVDIVPESLKVELDWTDVTAIVELSDDGFLFRPVQVLPPGEHILLVSFLTEGQREVSREYSFATRHTKIFEEVYSENKISTVYSRILKESHSPGDAEDKEISDWSVEANLNSRNYLSDGPWEWSLETNARYMEQDLPLQEPTDEGAEVVDYLLKGKYEKGKFSALAATGDISIDQTRNTVNYLSRRGGKVRVDYGISHFTGFIVRSDQVYGLDGEWGVEPDTDDHLLGVSGGIDLFDNRMEIKTVYATGGEEVEDTSYGVWPQSRTSKGDVFGVLIKTDFFDGKFTTKIEADQSDYDLDTSDKVEVDQYGYEVETSEGIEYEKDEALLVELSGTVSRLDYEIVYEYTGPYYRVPLNSSIQRDWEGFKLNSGLLLEDHSIRGSFSRYNDNVKSDPTYARIYSYDYGLDYNMSIFSSLPVALSWCRSSQESTDEPPQAFETDSHTDTFSGDITYMAEQWSVGLQPMYSRLDDKTQTDYDTDSVTLTLLSSYYSDRFEISPTIMFNRSKDYATGIDTDTYMYSLQFKTEIMEGLDVEGTGSFEHMADSDDSVDEDLWSVDMQVGYGLTRRIWDVFSPRIALCWTHQRSKDYISHTESKETTIYLTLTCDIRLSF